MSEPVKIHLRFCEVFHVLEILRHLLNPGGRTFEKRANYEWKFQNAQKFQNDQALELNMNMKEIVK